MGGSTGSQGACSGVLPGIPIFVDHFAFRVPLLPGCMMAAVLPDQALASLRDPRSGEELDRSLVLRFPGPASFTGAPAPLLRVQQHLKFWLTGHIKSRALPLLHALVVAETRIFLP